MHLYFQQEWFNFILSSLSLKYNQRNITNIFCLLNADVKLMNLIKKNPGKSISCYTGQKFDTCNQKQRYRLSYIKISKTLARIKCCTMTNVALCHVVVCFWCWRLCRVLFLFILYQLTLDMPKVNLTQFLPRAHCHWHKDCWPWYLTI